MKTEPTDTERIEKLEKKLKWISVTCVLFAVHFVAVHMFPSYFFYDRIFQQRYKNLRGGGHGAEKAFEKDGHRYLYGGQQDHEHFKIDNLVLNTDQFHYGLGRENFQALVNPRFEPAHLASSWLQDSDAVIGLNVNGEQKAYPISLLTTHEVVNDTVGGDTIFASYCILANLACVYNRRINDREFTFAVSGFTYYDPAVWGGLDAFILWDRDTESLWWPPIGTAVSGDMVGAKMRVFDRTKWGVISWGQMKKQYPNVKVLSRGQSYAPDSEFSTLADGHAEYVARTENFDSISPFWGQNAEVETEGSRDKLKQSPRSGSHSEGSHPGH
jgi:hypothetical protein